MRKHIKNTNTVLREDVLNNKSVGEIKYRLYEHNNKYYILSVFILGNEFTISIFRYRDIAISYYNSIILTGGFNPEMLKHSLKTIQE